MSKNRGLESHDERQQDLGSSESTQVFANRFYPLNNTQFVDGLLQNSKTTAVRDSLINALNAGTKTRVQVLKELVYVLDAGGKEIHEISRPSHSAGATGHENSSLAPRKVVSVVFEGKPSIPTTLVPPINAEFILHIFLKRDELDAVVGDLLEKYKKIWERFGPRRAKFWFYSEIARSLWPLLKRLVVRAGGLIALGEWIRRHVS